MLSCWTCCDEEHQWIQIGVVDAVVVDDDELEFIKRNCSVFGLDPSTLLEELKLIWTEFVQLTKGYSGADCEYLIQQACLVCYLEHRQQRHEQQLQEIIDHNNNNNNNNNKENQDKVMLLLPLKHHFQKAASVSKSIPSVSKQEIKEYKDWRKTIQLH